ncbi:MAG: hypothetical protein M1816_006104 [Peltula sp. TS41687]|nr:MAG: hypothetical protein M1816_006104 [Peltula sp. TS41687]
MSSERKIVVVFGATGTQGGSVIKSILDDPRAKSQFKIRGITRDPSKPNAKALAEKGVECVTVSGSTMVDTAKIHLVGDLNSKDSLREAFKGAYAVYAVTNYWEKEDAELEIQQGRNVADVAKECGVQHLIWSALMDVSELSNGKYTKVYHFDSKAAVESYIRSVNVPSTSFIAGFYMSNLPGGMIRPHDPSKPKELTFAMPFAPDTKMPLFDAADDTGKFVKAILLQRDQTLGKRVCGATDYYTPDQIVQQLNETKPGVEAKFVQISDEDFMRGLANAGFSERVQVELLQNMLFMPEFGYFGKEDLAESVAILDEKPTTWKEFIEKAPAWKDL